MTLRFADLAHRYEQVLCGAPDAYSHRSPGQTEERQ